MLQNSCIENAKLWTLVYKLQKANPQKKIVLTSEQRYALCNYMNGRPFDRTVIKEFLQ